MKRQRALDGDVRAPEQRASDARVPGDEAEQIGPTPGLSLSPRLIASLSEVADAVTSAGSYDRAVEAIVDRAKGVTDTDKAILVMTVGRSGRLDFSTMVVRGRLGRHLQDWWEKRLQTLANTAFSTGAPALDAYPYEHAVILGCPVTVRRRAVGLLCVINSEDRPFTAEQVEFVQVLSAFAATCIENKRLGERNRYVLLASERDRIAREMHDGVVQSLFSISLGLEVCKKQVFTDPDSVSLRLEDLQSHLNSAMVELRRFIYDLSPMKLNELGLIKAVEYWVREITQGRSVTGSVRVSGDASRLSPSEEACLYRVAKEAVSNAVRHASASHFEVTIAVDEESVRLSVADDGDGFDAMRVMGGATEGLGLKSARDRIVREGGTLDVTSAAGRGTTVTAELPMGS